MISIIVFFRTMYFYVMLVILGIVLFIPALVCVLLPASYRYDTRLYYWLSHAGYWWYLKAARVPIVITGKENVPKEPVIFVANHQSALDIPLLGSAGNTYPHIWVVLKDVAVSNPIFYFFARKMSVLVDISAPRRAVQAIKDCINLTKDKKRHLMIFPEGGRYVDGKIHEFFAGFAIITRHTQRPVVPVLLIDTHKVYPPFSWWLYWHPVKAVVGKPIQMLENESDRDFADRVHKWFTEEMEKQA